MALAFPVSSDGVGSVIGDVPKYATTSGQIITTSSMAAASAMLRDGTVAATGDINMNNNRVLDLPEQALVIQNITITSSSTTYLGNSDADWIIVDSRNFTGKVSLIPPTVNRTLYIQLAYQASFPVSIITAFGNEVINASTPCLKLAYTGSQWFVFEQSTTTALPPSFATSTKLIPWAFIPGVSPPVVSYIDMDASGNYIAFGSPNDNTNQGAAYIWFWNGTTWTQQAKLIGTGNTGPAGQGRSVSLTKDAGMLAVGGDLDNTNVGSAWIYTRSGTSWTQQAVISPVGYTGPLVFFGYTLQLTYDGQRLFVGAPNDNSGGSVYVYENLGGGSSWAPLQRITYTDATMDSKSGTGAALSCNYDGSILAIGAYGDGNVTPGDFTGAVVLFHSTDLTTWSISSPKIRSPDEVKGGYFGGVTVLNASGTLLIVGDISNNANTGQDVYYSVQNGVATLLNKISGSDVVGGTSSQGFAVPAVSADGTCALLGGYFDDSGVGCVWLTRNTGTGWVQVGPKITVSGTIGIAEVGAYSACSSDFSVVCTQGLGDDSGTGAVWVFR